MDEVQRKRRWWKNILPYECSYKYNNINNQLDPTITVY